MAASTSMAVPSAQDGNSSRMRVEVDRNAKEVKDCTSQYEDRCTLVEALYSAMKAPENKSVLDILSLSEHRLDAALGRENTAIANLANFCVAERSVLHVQAAATVAASATLAPPVSTTTSKAVSDKKIMKRKLPELRGGWKDGTSKNHKAHLEAITFHKTLSTILWQLMDIVHWQISGGSTPTPDVLLASLTPLVTIEENLHNYNVLELL
jgi:hypothetical protein